MATWRVALSVPGRCVDLFSAIFDSEAAALAIWGEETDAVWLLEATFVHRRPDESTLRTRLALAAAASGIPAPDLVLEPVHPIDWAAASRAGFPPFRVGRFHIHGTHHTDKALAASVDLCIDAATAFGTGEHGSTQGCLIALERLAPALSMPARRPRRVLDMGCGSGILAIAASRLLHRPVLAVDIDAEATRQCRRNARVNGVAPLVRSCTGAGYATASVRSGRGYDLVFANILARPLVRMAPALARVLNRPGWVILSGFLDRHERRVLLAHRRFGLALAGRVTVSGWRTLVLRRGRLRGLRSPPLSRY